jgi:hypothetical protein
MLKEVCKPLHKSRKYEECFGINDMLVLVLNGNVYVDLNLYSRTSKVQVWGNLLMIDNY